MGRKHVEAVVVKEFFFRRKLGESPHLLQCLTQVLSCHTNLYLQSVSQVKDFTHDSKFPVRRAHINVKRENECLFICVLHVAGRSKEITIICYKQ